jgi:DNA-binding beta-propeller fold protein YncE
MWRTIKWITGSIAGLSLIAVLAFVQFGKPEEAKATEWDISTAGRGVTTSTVLNITYPESVYLSPDGMKMYLPSSVGDKIAQYNLTSAWDISTAGYYQSTSTAKQETYPRGVFFNPDGTKMYVTGDNTNSILQYNLTSAWDISTAGYYTFASVAAGSIARGNVFFDSDGLKMYVVNDTANTIARYDLSIAWDITTASASPVASTSTAAQDATPTGVFLKNDGTKMYVTGDTNDRVYEYNLTSAWDISTAGYYQSTSTVANCFGNFFKNDGTKMFILRNTTHTIYEYNLPAASTPSIPPTTAQSTPSKGWGAGVSAGGSLNW